MLIRGFLAEILPFHTVFTFNKVGFTYGIGHMTSLLLYFRFRPWVGNIGEINATTLSFSLPSRDLTRASATCQNHRWLAPHFLYREIPPFSSDDE